MGMRFSIFSIIGILVAVALAAGVVFGVVFIVKRYQHAKVNGDKTAKKWYVVTILSVTFMFLSWIFNMGWYRLILTWIPIPLIHTIFFLLTNFKASAKAASFPRLEKYIILSCATFLLSYLLFPDGGDIGEAYFFFGLIRNSAAANIMMYIAELFFISNIAVLILEYIKLRKCESQ